MERPNDWIEFVNGTESEFELDDLRLSGQRGRPFGQRRLGDQNRETTWT